MEAKIKDKPMDLGRGSGEVRMKYMILVKGVRAAKHTHR